jgi:predicted small lipoprotein YifL
MNKASLRVAFSFCAVIFFVTACGQTGPLYLPQPRQSAAKSPTQSTTVKSSNSAAISSVAASAATATAVQASSAH